MDVLAEVQEDLGNAGVLAKRNGPFLSHVGVVRDLSEDLPGAGRFFLVQRLGQRRTYVLRQEVVRLLTQARDRFGDLCCWYRPHTS